MLALLSLMGRKHNRTARPCNWRAASRDARQHASGKERAGVRCDFAHLSSLMAPRPGTCVQGSWPKRRSTAVARRLPVLLKKSDGMTRNAPLQVGGVRKGTSWNCDSSGSRRGSRTPRGARGAAQPARRHPAEPQADPSEWPADRDVGRDGRRGTLPGCRGAGRRLLGAGAHVPGRCRGSRRRSSVWRPAVRHVFRVSVQDLGRASAGAALRRPVPRLPGEARPRRGCGGQSGNNRLEGARRADPHRPIGQ